MYKKRKAKEQGNETLKQLMQTSDSEEALQLMRKHTREELCKVLEYAETNFELTVTSFIHENLRDCAVPWVPQSSRNNLSSR